MPQATKPHSLHIAAPPFCSKDGMRLLTAYVKRIFQYHLRFKYKSCLRLRGLKIAQYLY